MDHCKSEAETRGCSPPQRGVGASLQLEQANRRDQCCAGECTDTGSRGQFRRSVILPKEGRGTSGAEAISIWVFRAGIPDGTAFRRCSKHRPHYVWFWRGHGISISTAADYGKAQPPHQRGDCPRLRELVLVGHGASMGALARHVRRPIAVAPFEKSPNRDLLPSD